MYACVYTYVYRKPQSTVSVPGCLGIKASDADASSFIQSVLLLPLVTDASYISIILLLTMMRRITPSSYILCASGLVLDSLQIESLSEIIHCGSCHSFCATSQYDYE